MKLELSSDFTDFLGNQISEYDHVVISDYHKLHLGYLKQEIYYRTSYDKSIENIDTVWKIRDKSSMRSFDPIARSCYKLQSKLLNWYYLTKGNIRDNNTDMFGRRIKPGDKVIFSTIEVLENGLDIGYFNEWVTDDMALISLTNNDIEYHVHRQGCELILYEKN
jgi:hypothetical protein